MIIRIDNAYIYSSYDESFLHGSLSYNDNGIIVHNDIACDHIIDANGALAIPGFVDVHTHGRNGFDFCTADSDGIKCMCDGYLSVGTTSIMPTLASAKYADLLSASDRINSEKYLLTGAEILGIHLEGRYLNPNKKGAHAASLLSQHNISELEELVFRMQLPCRITSALELDTIGFAKRAKELGVTLSLGHTEATYSQAIKLYTEFGIGFSHLFNAMPPLHHRDGGAVCAGLLSGAVCELICDGMHISPEMIRMAYGLLGNKKASLITDSMEATGCSDGSYSIAGNPCTVKNGKALTKDGKLAGSTLDMKTALENLMQFCNIPLQEALRCATLTPAEEIECQSIVGSLDVGKHANILLIREKNSKITIEKTICRGHEYANALPNR